MKSSWGVKYAVFLYFLVAVSVLVAIGKTNCQDVEDNVLETHNIKQSQNDGREYKYIILKNSLRVLLVSDPSSDKCAAAVSINAGYSSDPPSVPGIAHFCEHMLFLGTKKYPKESGFGLFLSQHNGRTNAYTSSEFTTYHFDINSEFFQPALDRFAQFFISPLFNQNATDRELNAINQEHEKNILDDSRRIYYIERASAKAGHRYGVFGTGNLDTLQRIPKKKGISIREKLLTFYKRYYSANIMSVVVMGKQSIKELEEMTVPLFKDVKNNNVILPSYKDNLPYGKNELGVLLKIPAVKEMNRLELKFQLFDLKHYYMSKPADYLSQVIGHEGKGSLLSLLKKKGWAFALWAGDRAGLKGFEFFIIGMDLTEEGLGHVDDIIGITFQYINMLKREKPKEWIFKEMKGIGETRFRYKDKSNARRYVQTLAKDMHLYPPVDVLYGHYRYKTFDSNLITEVLEKLNPTNFRYFIASQTFSNQTTNRHVDYFDVGYVSEKIPEATIKKWQNIGYDDELYLPARNPFIPENLRIVVPRKNEEVKGVPTLIRDTELSRAWYKADDTFYVPKTSIKIAIYSPYASMTPSYYNHLNMFVHLVKYAMVEYGYDAQLADVRYNIQRLFYGFVININGFSSKQDVLLKKILNHITKLHIDPAVFQLVKTQLINSLNNADITVPYRQTEKLKNYVINEKTWDHKERLKYIDDLTVDSLKLFIPTLLKDIYIESLFCGNLLQEDALRMLNDVEQMLIEAYQARPMLPIQHIRSREYNIPPGRNYLYEERSKIHDFSAVQIYLQVGVQDTRNNVLCELFYLMSRTPIFVTLRTKQQLGYIVFSGFSRSQSVQGIRIQVQSNKSPTEVEKKIDDFLKDFKLKLNMTSKAKFQSFIDAAVVRKLEKPKRIGHEASIFALEIYKKQYNFRKAMKEVEVLKKLKLKDIMDFYETYVNPESKLRKKLAIVVLGGKANSTKNGRGENYWTQIKDVVSFKNSLPLYPHMLPSDGIPLVKRPN